MHIDTLTLKRFRSCADVTIKLRPDVTVLVGENNGGKSNIVDGLRLLISPLSGRRDRYPDDEDLRRGSAEGSFTIEGRFAGLSDTLKGLLIAAVPDPTIDSAIFGMRYQTKVAGSLRGRSSFWAGKFDTSEPEPGSTDLIRHVYLPPLRDAKQTLGSGSATRISALLGYFLEEGEEAGFLEYVKRSAAPHRVVAAVNEEIEAALRNLTKGVRPQAASLGFTTEALSDVARDLRFRLGDAGMTPEDIRSSGLGYANLLYISAVVVELARAREADLTLFLVEEPEAHLHPQLQLLVLDFLLDQAQKSSDRAAASGQPEGRIQVVVTTHSPNLTAWVSPEHIVVVRSVRDAEAIPPTRHTVSIPVTNLGLDQDALNKVSRYLDVTRSALLFGNRALLVEGIAESLLIPVIAKRRVLSDDAEAWQRFRGAVLVAIDGVDFAPYVEILLRPFGGATIADRVVVVTDADPGVPGNRKEDLEALAGDWGVSDRLKIFTNSFTLEHELFVAGNEALLKQIFLEFHPRSEGRWRTDIERLSSVERPKAFVELLYETRTRKGDFAQQLAAQIDAGNDFNVPHYLKEAILAASAP
jgi:putative ATP-dependent endonuclease of OLD family